jgi:DNA-binding response OmpR family regulator
MKEKTIVVCDDNASLVSLIKHLLAKKGFTVFSAIDGEEGLGLVRAQKADVLLLDFHFEKSGTSGLDVLAGLEDLGDERPYTIMISGHEGRDLREKAAKLGADEVWKKPFNASELLSRLDALVREEKI